MIFFVCNSPFRPDGNVVLTQLYQLLKMSTCRRRGGGTCLQQEEAERGEPALSAVTRVSSTGGGTWEWLRDGTLSVLPTPENRNRAGAAMGVQHTPGGDPTATHQRVNACPPAAAQC